MLQARMRFGVTHNPPVACTAWLPLRIIQRAGQQRPLYHQLGVAVRAVAPGNEFKPIAERTIAVIENSIDHPAATQAGDGGITGNTGKGSGGGGGGSSGGGGNRKGSNGGGGAQGGRNSSGNSGDFGRSAGGSGKAGLHHATGLKDAIALFMGVAAAVWAINLIYSSLNPDARRTAATGKALEAAQSTAERGRYGVLHGANAAQQPLDETKHKPLWGAVKGHSKAAEAQGVVERAGHLAQRGAQAVRHGAEEAKDKVNETVHKTQQKAREKQEATERPGRGLLNNIKDAVSGAKSKVNNSVESTEVQIRSGVGAMGDKVGLLSGRRTDDNNGTLKRAFGITAGTVGAIGVIAGTALAVDQARRASSKKNGQGGAGKIPHKKTADFGSSSPTNLKVSPASKNLSEGP